MIYAKFGAARTQSAKTAEKRREPSTDRAEGELGINIGLGVAACLGKLRLWVLPKNFDLCSSATSSELLGSFAGFNQ